MVTYKWLGRRFNVPYDTAKRILFQFLTKHGQVCVCVCVLGAWAAAQPAAARPNPVCRWRGSSLQPALPQAFSCTLHCSPQKVKATFLLSGWAAAEDSGEARHVVRLIEGQQVRSAECFRAADGLHWVVHCECTMML